MIVIQKHWTVSQTLFFLFFLLGIQVPSSDVTGTHFMCLTWLYHRIFSTTTKPCIKKMFLYVPCIIYFLEKYFFLTYFQVNRQNSGNFEEICNKYQSKVENCTKTKFCLTNLKVHYFHICFCIFSFIPQHIWFVQAFGSENL